MAYAQQQQQQQQPMMEHQREPCPDRILDDIGGAFAMGAVGGGAWHFIKALKNSPSGYRFKGAVEALRKESPRLGGSFANWGLTFSCFDCSLQAIRKKEDPWNAIGAGALTGGFLQLRFGVKSAAKSAAFGGFLLALIEGLGIALTKLTSPAPPGVPYQPPPGMGGAPGAPGMPGMPGAPPIPGMPDPALAGGEASSGPASWFNGLFGGSEAAKPDQSSSLDLNEDPFVPPPMPAEFGAGQAQGGQESFKHG